MENQDKETSNNLNPVCRLGDHGINGGPGRPKGLANKFTMIKRDMLEVWQEEDGKERFRQLFKGSSKDFLKALEKIVTIMPKDSPADLESKEGLKIVIVRPSEENSSKSAS